MATHAMYVNSAIKTSNPNLVAIGTTQKRVSFVSSNVMHCSPCADPESFVRGGPNLITFLFVVF